MASLLSNMFGSGAAGEAAAKNAKLYQGYQTDGLGVLDTGTLNSQGALQSGYGQANSALDANKGVYSDYGTIARGALDSGLTNGVNSLNGANAAYAPLSALGAKYGAATTLGLDSLGVNGSAGNQNAVNAFQTGPGYGFQMDQGLQALQRTRNAQGMLNSGNTDVDAIKFGQGLANQSYGDWQNKLLGFTNPELSATSGAATGQAGVATNLANLYNTNGQNQAGVAGNVATGLSGINTGQAANDAALGNTLGTLYQNDATNRVGVVGNAVSGTAQSNNQAAAAEQQGAKNLLGAGLGVASLAMGGGGLGGLGSLFGGSGGMGSALGSLGLTYGLPGTPGSNLYGPKAG
jgi:hypothetical protein